MSTALITLLFSALWNAGSAQVHDVTQTPTTLWKQHGDSAEMNCSHTKGVNYNQMYWYRQRQGETMSLVVFTTSFGTKEFGDVNSSKYSTIKTVPESGSLTVIKLESDDSGIYFCSVSDRDPAEFGPGTKLTVLDPNQPITGPEVKVLPPNDSERCNKELQKKRKEKSVTLVCLATDFYPDHVSVSWKVNGQKQEKGVGTDNSAIRDDQTNLYSITSRLRIPVKTWMKPKNKFTCVVKFYNGTGDNEFSDSIHGRKGEDEADPDHYVRSAQTAKFAYTIFIAKSCLFGLFIYLFVRKQTSQGSDAKW